MLCPIPWRLGDLGSSLEDGHEKEFREAHMKGSKEFSSILVLTPERLDSQTVLGRDLRQCPLGHQRFVFHIIFEF